MCDSLNLSSQGRCSLKAVARFLFLQLLGTSSASEDLEKVREWPYTATAGTVNSLVCFPSGPVDTYGLSSLEVSNSVLAYCWSSPPPMLPLSTEVWRMCLVKTGAKKAWSTSALPVSTVTESPASVAVFCEN